MFKLNLIQDNCLKIDFFSLGKEKHDKKLDLEPDVMRIVTYRNSAGCGNFVMHIYVLNFDDKFNISNLYHTRNKIQQSFCPACK